MPRSIVTGSLLQTLMRKRAAHITRMMANEQHLSTHGSHSVTNVRVLPSQLLSCACVCFRFRKSWLGKFRRKGSSEIMLSATQRALKSGSTYFPDKTRKFLFSDPTHTH